MDSSIVQLVNCLIESVPIDIMPLILQFGVEFSELVLNCLSFNFQFLVVKLVFRSTVDAEFKDLVSFFSSFLFHFDVAQLD